ncbi:MAG: phage scaffolding protein [Lachnospiraceae bacterium]|nr:phage scaffolding protein [Lachnospiraceae bacterium]
MKKEDLLQMEGMTEELATKIAKQSAEELKEYVPKSQLAEANEAKKKAEALVGERDKQLEQLKKATGDNEELKKQIEQLQEDNKTVKQQYEADIKKMQVNNAVTMALKDAGAKNVIATTALLKHLDKAEIGEDGTIKGLAEQIEALQKSDSYLFEKKVNTKPSGATPANGTAQTSTDSTWASKLAEARKNGNTLEVINIKQQAFQEGIVLV